MKFVSLDKPSPNASSIHMSGPGIYMVRISGPFTRLFGLTIKIQIVGSRVGRSRTGSQ